VPDAFTPEIQKRLHEFDKVDKIEISFQEAKKAFACNLVSTGETVVMSAHAPKFQKELENRGFKVITPEVSEIANIRCTTLTLNNV
jgi:N-dimethylarginine dimethylaminohydrolase